jgi:competence protein ComEC
VGATDEPRGGRSLHRAGAQPMADGLTVIIMDAGQGDAILIVYPDDKLVMIDCGCLKNSGVVRTEISTVLARYLPNTKPKKNHLTALVLTHSDADHYNQVQKVIVDNNTTVGMLLYSGMPEDYGSIAGWVKKNQPKPLGDNFYMMLPIPALSYNPKSKDGISGRILAANVGGKKNDPNPKSIVILLTYLQYNIFLMGDATEETENFIIKRDLWDQELTNLLTGRHTMLKAGHHGSATSSSADWLDLIKPEVVFVSSDTRGFGDVSLPRSTIMDRFLAGKTLVELFPKNPPQGLHQYIQYNDQKNVHEQVPCTLGLCTTLNFLKFNGTKFTAYGTSWHYKIADAVTITPSCEWENVNKAY